MERAGGEALGPYCSFTSGLANRPNDWVHQAPLKVAAYSTFATVHSLAQLMDPLVTQDKSGNDGQDL